MMELLKHEEFGELRIQQIDGRPWFVAKDVCQALQMKQEVSSALRNLDEDEKLIVTLSLSGQQRDVWCVNESGVYHLIFKSRMPKAMAFRKWVTSEVLPALHQRGSYTMPEARPRARSRQMELFQNMPKYSCKMTAGDMLSLVGYILQNGVKKADIVKLLLSNHIEETTEIN